MNPALLHALTDSLGLPLVEETPEGSLKLNTAAREVTPPPARTTMTEALEQMTGGDMSREDLRTALGRARNGQYRECVSPNRRVLVLPLEQGRAAAVVAPAELPAIAALHRRAAATDLAAGVSHELANTLGAIAGWARVARDGADRNDALELIERSAESAWSTARQMLGSVSREQAPAEQTLDLSALVRDTLRLLAPKATRAQVSVRSHVTDDIHVRGGRGDYWSVVWNLASNAIEAMANRGGTLELELSLHGAAARLVISDDGPGMQPHVRDRVFDRYFTTKEQGSGLGLAFVNHTVEGLGGSIQLDTKPGHGTRFVVDLPACRPAWRPEQAARTGPVHDSHTSGVYTANQLHGRFLIVDDDEALRGMMATAIGMRGAHVTAVATASEALASEGSFDVAIIDMLLPDASGDELLARLRQQNKVKTALIVTGIQPREDLADGGVPDAFLRKPFELDQLFERTAELLSPLPHPVQHANHLN